MKQSLVLFALIAVGSASIWEGGFRVRFDVGDDIGGSFFYDIPRTLTDAVSNGWVSQTQPDGLPVKSVSMYCYSDNIVCCFYDANGDVAGMQVALPKDKFTPHYEDMDAVGFTNWAVDSVEYYTLQQYFTTEEILSSHAKRNENKITENGGVWVVGTNKEVVYISNSTTELAGGGVFTEQACAPWMGRHYYYKMDSSVSCDEPIFPWFTIVESGELIATGLMVFGELNLDLETGARNWFENPPESAVRAIITSGPECLYLLATSPGLVTMHVYYIDQPWLISCI
ncbi:uncharacterized protein LOC125232986 [Leguminivora glycinivorella]|uniref:uncharacterized protein LOC125232986 n=1 Tax=Leguminivora glycinivorella TaxID=1035111 RepID=UPI00200BC275|nr:uncharacterized protein LOC125232986 [Leguminivora glycinivorella]